MYQSIENIIKQLTLEEKASLCSGTDFWHTESVERLGIPSVMVTDGPHGLPATFPKTRSSLRRWRPTISRESKARASALH